MSYKVKLSSGNNYKVKLSSNDDLKTKISYQINLLPMNLNDLTDVTIRGNIDNYVLMYDADLGQWVDKNPDEVLSAAVEDQTPGYEGLPANFINQLVLDLDNKISIDAGEY
jgi:hypothetical protein